MLEKLQPPIRTKALLRQQRILSKIGASWVYTLGFISTFVRADQSTWKSCWIQAVRDTVGTATYFMIYESAKQVLTTVSLDKSSANPFAIVIAGGVCGVASWALIYPIDSVKSIYQTNSLTTSKGQPVPSPPRIQFRNKRMYRGLGVSMGRSCLVNSIFFSAFEFVKKNVVN